MVGSAHPKVAVVAELKLVSSFLEISLSLGNLKSGKTEVNLLKPGFIPML
jgi:hypothetical protein